MTNSRMVLLISGGIDSPVAGYMMGRQGVEIVALSGFVNPEGDRAHVEKVSKIVARLSKVLDKQIDLYTFEHRIAQAEFYDSANPRFTCVLCKRMLLRMAERLCQKIGANAIVMGDSLGQVASQTLQNIAVIEQAVSTPIVRPLVGLDKTEIVDIARRIGTFDLSNLESPKCIFVPPRPATKARLDAILKDEEQLPIQKLIDQLTVTLKKIEVNH